MNDYKKLMTKVEDFVTDAFSSSNKNQFPYHNMGHTQNVVTRSYEIAAHYELSEIELAQLGIAAWFHDIGHLYTNPAQHEEKSVEIMNEFMEEHQVAKDFTETVAGIIMATSFKNEPETLLQQIIRDADTYHFGTKEFKKTNKQVKSEYEQRGLSTFTGDWEINTVERLKSHQFYTDYCIKILTKGKEKNLAKAEKKMIRKGHSRDANNKILRNIGDRNEAGEPMPSRFLEKGIQTSLRLTSENHIKLSDMADSKANILISVNAIIISVILSILVRKISVEKHLAIPTFIFLAFSVITIIISILATRPKVTSGEFTREDVLHKKTNLLFFGNFYQKTLEEYTWAVSTMFRDPDYLYGAMVEDIYFLGVVLGRKYKLLRLAYSIFMIGIVLSVIAFTIAIFVHDPESQAVIITNGGNPF